MGIITKHRFLLTGLLFTFLCLITIFLLGALGWPGIPEPCLLADSCYCEHFQMDQIIRQPVNTWTNLLAVSIGLCILYHLDRKRVPPEEVRDDTTITKAVIENPMQIATIFSGLFGILVIFVGTGSMFFHASGMYYGGLIDNISMQTFVTFLLIYDFQRIFKFSKKVFIITWSLVNIIMGILVKWPGIFLGNYFFGIPLLIIIFFEPILYLISAYTKQFPKRLNFIRSMKYYLLSLCGYIGATIAWVLSGSSGVFCWPYSIWQGHGLWHLLVALTTLMIFFYLRSERPRIK